MHDFEAEPMDDDAPFSMQHSVKADPAVVVGIIRELDGKLRAEVNGLKIPAMNVCILQQADGTHLAQILVHLSHAEFGNDRGKHGVN
jgi:hypothetical protein